MNVSFKRCIQDERENSRSEFSFPDINMFYGKCPVFQMPKCVGYYSLDDQREFHQDLSQLRYLSLPKEKSPGEWEVNFNLRKDIDKAIMKDQDAVQMHMLDDLLKWILIEKERNNTSIFRPNSECLRANFVCFRGLLTLLMATPYEYNEPWTIIATKFKNTIYMFQLKENDACNNNPKLEEISKWGFKFEQYLCSDKPGNTPNHESQLNVNPELSCILKTSLSEHALLYGAEVDAIKQDAPFPSHTLENFIELKTNRHVENYKQDRNFKRYKLLKWWAQSFLVGIPTIICGYRNDNGVVSRLKSFSVHGLPSMAKGLWEPSICMNFCATFLKVVNEAISSSNPAIHYTFTYVPSKKCIMIQETTENELRRPLLPLWFIKKFDAAGELHG